MTDLRTRYGSTALVTGASAGIGAAFARQLAALGLDLVVTARRRDRLEALAAGLEERYGVKVHVIDLDLARPDSPAELERRLAESGLEIDILINNAGFGVYEEFGTGEPAADLAMIDLHCRAVAELTWRLLPPMKRRRRGAVVIVSSVLGAIPAPYLATYAATKAFDLSLGESLYGELKPYNIDALAVMPTLTETEFHAGAGMGRPWYIVRRPEQVVATTLRALGRRASVSDGRFTKLWMGAVRFLPRTWLIALYRRYRKPPR